MILQVKKFKSQRADALPIVLLHGWGLGSSIWSDCIEALTQRHPVYVLEMPGYAIYEQAALLPSECVHESTGPPCLDPDKLDIQAQLQAWNCDLPEAFALVGFSLGGAVASVLSSSLFRGAIGLVTVSTNARFVVEEGWQNAVKYQTFLQFLEDFDADAAALMKRFCMLQSRGSRDEKSLRQWLLNLQDSSPLSSDAAALAWQKFGLEALQQLDLRVNWSTQSLPLLHHFGARDALVPFAAVSDIAQQSRGQTEIFAESGHLPFVTEKDAWVDSIFKFAEKLSMNIDGERADV